MKENFNFIMMHKKLSSFLPHAHFEDHLYYKILFPKKYLIVALMLLTFIR